MSKDNNFTYEVIEKDEANSLNDKVLKRGIEAEFHMFELDQHQDALMKRLDELRGQLNLEAAKQTNVEEHHDDAIALIRELAPEKMEAIRIWLNSKKVIDDHAPMRDKLEEAMELHKAEVEEIIKITGWEPPKDAEENNKEDDETKEVSESESE
jgi:hypothetical protein